MRFLKNKYFILAFAIVVIASIAIAYSQITTTHNTAIVKLGSLETSVQCMGEVQGEKAIEINLPEELCDREMRIWGLKIVDMIAEGKSVKKGDYVAQLDNMEILNPMREKMKEKEQKDASLKNAHIDSTVTLTQKREDIINAQLDLEYKKIDLDQSIYDSGTAQRKAKMSYQKAQIELDRKKRAYLLEQNKQKVRVQRFENDVKELDEEIGKYQMALRSTRITSPGEGIIIFAKDWMGKKLTKDSEVSLWNPKIATLPDMSSAIIETYVKEIEISKISNGDSVNIVIDALPDKQFSGHIYHIAAIGEDHNNFDMKVFRVMIRFDNTDKDLKPGMSCECHILVDKYEDVILAPLSSVFRDSDSSFVFIKSGPKIIRKEIQTGAEDDNNIVVLNGLSAGDKILLEKPEKYQTANL